MTISAGASSIPTLVTVGLRKEAETATALRLVNPLEEPGWDELVMSHPGATFFHGAAWARVLHDTYGFRPCYLLARRGNRLLGMLPVMDVRSWLTGRRGVSLPFTDECPPLASEEFPTPALLAELTRCGRSRGWKYWECRGVRDLPAGTPVAGSYFGHLLDLTPGEPRLFEGFKTTVRQKIRKAERAGLHVEVARNGEALRVFCQLHYQTRRRLGVPPQPSGFFRNLERSVLSANSGILMVARHQGRAIAGAVFFVLGKRAVYKYSASDPAARDLPGPNLILWSAIQWFARNGCETLDFGRTDAGAESLRTFKLGWGTREETIAYVRHDYRSGGYASPAALPTAAGWKNTVLRRLPLFLLRMVGGLLYRHTA